MNFVWTALNKGTEPDLSLYFSRKTDPDSYKKDEDFYNMLDSIIGSTDTEYINYMIERFTQMSFNSPIKDKFETLDPSNTYDYLFSVEEEVVVVQDNLPMNVNVFLDKTADVSWINKIVHCYVNVSTQTLTVVGDATVHDLNMADNLSALITVEEGVTLRLQGALAAANFSFTLNIVNLPPFNINEIVTSMQSIAVPTWVSAEIREYWMYGSAVEKASAFVYNMVSNLKNGN